MHMILCRCVAGRCELYWAFYLTASAGGLTLLCSLLALCAPSSKADYSWRHDVLTWRPDSPLLALCDPSSKADHSWRHDAPGFSGQPDFPLLALCAPSAVRDVIYDVLSWRTDPSLPIFALCTPARLTTRDVMMSSVGESTILCPSLPFKPQQCEQLLSWRQTRNLVPGSSREGRQLQIQLQIITMSFANNKGVLKLPGVYLEYGRLRVTPLMKTDSTEKSIDVMKDYTWAELQHLTFIKVQSP